MYILKIKKHSNINLMKFRVFLFIYIFFNCTKCSCFLLWPLQMEHALFFRFLYAILSFT